MSDLKPLTPEMAIAIYTTLRLVGAPRSMQENFVDTYSRQGVEPPREWRFQGSLGLGGKFWLDWDGWRVTCYREDETKQINYLVETCNELFAILYSRWFRSDFPRD